MIFWAMFLAFNSPDLGGTDAFIFRDPGCNCAAHRGFVSLSVPNRPAAIPPELFADYTPGAPLLFAPAARIFGCRPYTDSYYNLFLLTLIAFFVVWVLPGDSEQRGQRTFAALLAGITLPVGLFLTGVDRPEPLALAFFFALLLLWKKVRNNWAKSLAAGLAGSLFLIHPYVGIVSYMLFLLLLMCSPGATGRLKIFFVSLAIAGMSVLTWALILHHADSSAIHRFMEHAFGAHSGAGVVLTAGSAADIHKGSLNTYATIMKKYVDSSSRLRGLPLVVLLIYFVILGVTTVRSALQPRRSTFAVLLALFGILFLLPMTIFSGQINYFAASSGLLFGMAAIGGYPLSDEMRRNRAAVLLLLTGAIFSSPMLAIRVLASVETKASYARATAQAARVKQLFLTRGRDQPRLLVDSGHLFVYKPEFANLYDVSYFKPGDSLTAFDGLVRCYTAQLAFSRAELSWESPLRREDWTLIDGDDDAAPISLFGRRVQRRNWSWACDVYARNKSEP